MKNVFLTYYNIIMISKKHNKIQLEELEQLSSSAQSRLTELLVKTSGHFHLKHSAGQIFFNVSAKLWFILARIHPQRLTVEHF